jgi:hypothetical protein
MNFFALVELLNTPLSLIEKKLVLYQIEAIRHKEIVTKAVSAIILILMKAVKMQRMSELFLMYSMLITLY